MQTKFLIREVDGSVAEREPTAGKWYAGVERVFFEDSATGDLEEVESYGALAEYVGEGCFCDEDQDYGPGNVDMRGYSQLAEQR